MSKLTFAQQNELRHAQNSIRFLLKDREECNRLLRRERAIVKRLESIEREASTIEGVIRQNTDNPIQNQ